MFKRIKFTVTKESWLGSTNNFTSLEYFPVLFVVFPIGVPGIKTPSLPDAKIVTASSGKNSSGKYSSFGFLVPLPVKIAWELSAPNVTGILLF